MSPVREPEDDVIERVLAKKKARHAQGAEYRSYMRWTGKAIEVPLGILVGALLGVVVEKRLGVPYATWVGLFAGICTAGRSAYRLVKSYKAAFPDDDEQQSGDSP